MTRVYLKEYFLSSYKFLWQQYLSQGIVFSKLQIYAEGAINIIYDQV